MTAPSNEPRAYPAARPEYPDLPSDWGWEASEPRLHSHRMVNGIDEAFDDRSEGQIDYEILRDTIIAAFNPPDEDAAEPSVMTASLDQAWAFIVSQPCYCPPVEILQDHASLDTVTDYYALQCARCIALGRSNDQRIER